MTAVSMKGGRHNVDNEDFIFYCNNRLDQPGILYCFKTGKLASFCTDSSSSMSSVTTPTPTTMNSQPPGKFGLGDS